MGQNHYSESLTQSLGTAKVLHFADLAIFSPQIHAVKPYFSSLIFR